MLDGNCSGTEPPTGVTDGTSATGPSTSGDAAVDAEDPTAINRKLKSICKGC
jgi:hypothetical protein